MAIQTKDCKMLTPLYIALQNGSFENVKLIVESVPEKDKERTNYINEIVPNKAYEGLPFHELPLAASVWSSRSAGKDMLETLEEMLLYLIENGADLELTRSDGNTLLHLLVLQAIESIEHLPYFKSFLKEAFNRAVGKWWIERNKSLGVPTEKLSASDAEVLGMKHLLKVTNKDGLTPIALAAKVESPLYLDLINWKYVTMYPDMKMGEHFSNVEIYDITNLASLKKTGNRYTYNQFSVMHVLAHNDVDLSEKIGDTDISTVEPLKTIISQKWGRVYQWIFYLWGLVHIGYMLAFTIITSNYAETTAKLQANMTMLLQEASTINIGNGRSFNETLPLAGEVKSGYLGPVPPGNPSFVFLLILPAMYFVSEIIDFCGTRQRFKFRYSLTGNFLYRVIAITFSLFTFVWFLLHMLQNVNQDIILSIALLLGWNFGIFFTRALNFPSKNSQIGAFSIMVQRMLFHDLIPFLLISSFVLVAFSAAIHATLMNTKLALDDGINIRLTFFQMVSYYSSLDDKQGFDTSREQEFAKTMLSIYGILTVVLLVNMLIAAMNKTYDMVRNTHTDLVNRQRLSILLFLERRLPFQFLRRKSQEGFIHKSKQNDTEDTSDKRPVKNDTEDTSDKWPVKNDTEDTSDKRLVENDTEDTSDKTPVEFEVFVQVKSAVVISKLLKQ